MVFRGGEGEITEKKSRFIATVRPVKSEEEAVEFILDLFPACSCDSHDHLAVILTVRRAGNPPGSLTVK